MLKYQYALANVWWNISGQDQPLFATPEAMQEYFDSVATPWGDLSNFSIGDSINTSIFIRVPELPLNEVLDKHYVIVREMDGDTVTKQYHYFATLSQDSGTQYFAQLTRDVVIDYYNFGEVRNRPYTYIMRTHLDRFVNEDGNLKVNGANDSPLYIAEDIETDRPLCVSNQQMNFTNSSGNNNLPSNSTMWVYVYVKKNAPILPELPEYYEQTIPMGYSVLVFPIGNFWLNDNGNRMPWNAFYFLTTLNTPLYKALIPYIFNIRVTLTPPDSGIWRAMNINNHPHTDFNVDIVNQYGVSVVTGNVIDNTPYQGFITYLKGTTIENKEQVTMTLSDNVPILSNLIGNIDMQLIKSPKSYKKEVKLYNGIISSNIASGNNKGITYNLLNLLYNKDNIFEFELYESLVAGITRYYYAISCETSLYNKKNVLGYNQNSNSVDTTVPYSENQYDTFLANNKNFYQATDSLYDSNLAKNILNSLGGGLTSGLIGMASGNVAGAAFGALTSTTLGVGNSVVDYLVSKEQRDYKMDNLRNAPPNVHNIDGNYMLIQSLTTLCPRFEIWQPMQSNLEKIADKLFFYGYNYQKIGTLSQFDTTRKYFNYIECDIAGIKYNMNDTAYRLLRDKLLNGVRFWHTNPVDVDFTTTDNYEVWVDEVEATGV